MSDKAKDDRPATAKALEEYARKVLDDKCKEYLKQKDGLPPVELKEDDKKKLKEWLKPQDTGSYTNKYPENKMDGGVRDWTFEILDWLKGDKGSVRVGKAQILIDYLASLLEKADKEKQSDNSKKAQEKYDNAKADHDEMVATPIGNYVFYPPETASKDTCVRNLFHTRKFIGQEVEHRVVNQVRVMHWNILADGLAGSGLGLNQFSKSLEKQFASPKESLIWDYRKWLILEEIAHFEPDIITLVELDGNQDYENRDNYKKTGTEDGKGPVYDKSSDFASKSLQYYLEKLDYVMEYKAKGAKFAEMGTGFFWKKDKFTPVKFKPKYDEGEADKKPKSDILLWKEFGQESGKQIFSLMRFNQTNGRNLAVCALHLQSDKDKVGEIKRAQQIWQALYWLNYKKYTDDLTKTFSEMNVKGTDGQKLSFTREIKDLTDNVNVMDEYAVIITGDFNAERKMGIDSKGTVFQPFAANAPLNAGYMSFYDEIYGGDLPWTSWKKRPAGRTDKYAIDYVFGQKSKTKPLAVLGKVPDNEVDNRTLLPNYESGSDHISLVVDFELIPFVEPSSPEDRLTQSDSYSTFTLGAVGVAIIVVVISILCWIFLRPSKRRNAESSSTSVD